MDVRQDYANKLRDIKDFYTNSVRDAEKQYDKQVDDLKTNQKQQVAEKEEAYAKQKTGMEEDFSLSKDEIQRKNEQTIHEQTERYKKNLRDTEKNFEQLSLKQNMDMRNRLRDLSEEYQTLRDDNRDHLEKSLFANKSAYEARDNRNLLNHQGEIDNFMDQADAKFNDQRLMNTQEIRDLNHRHDKDMGEMVKYNTDRRNLLTEQNANYVDELKNQHEYTTDKMKSDFTRDLANIKETKELENRQMENEYKNLMEENSRRSEKSRAISEGYLLDELKKVKTESELNAQKDKRISETLKANEAVQQKRIETSEKSVASGEDRRIQNLNKEIEDIRDTYDARERSAHEDYRLESSRDQRAANNHLADERRRLINQRNEDVDALTNEKKMLVENFRAEKYDTQINNDERIDFERQRAKRIVSNEREKFERTIEELGKDSREALAEVQRENAQEKLVLAERNRRDLNDTRLELKKDFSSIISAKEDNAEKTKQDYERRFKDMIETYEKELHNMRVKSANEINAIKQIAQGAHQEQVADFRMKLKQISAENEKEVVQIQNDFARKVSQIKHEDDVKLFETVSKYESDINFMKKENEKKLRQVTKRLQEQIKNQQFQNDVTKEAMRQQADTRIKQLQIDNRKAVEVVKRRSEATTNQA